MSQFKYQPILETGEDTTKYRKLTGEFVSQIELDGQKILRVEPAALEILAKTAFEDVSFYLREAHLNQLAEILDSPIASENDKFVAAVLLRNAIVSAAGELPSCQDTGTATVVASKGNRVFTDGNDAENLSRGIWETYQECNLRFSQIAPLDMYNEANTGDNMPAQVDISAGSGDEYKFLFVAKGGGSANKTALYQQNKSLLDPNKLEDFLVEKLAALGVAACPPYHLAVVIGGTSPEAVLKTVKLASTGYCDNMPTTGNELGRAFRDLELEKKLLARTRKLGFGAQFGGAYFAHDVRVIRMPRHAGSLPVGVGVSCSADRNIKAKITADGIFLEELDKNPMRFEDKLASVKTAAPVEVDIDRPIEEVVSQLAELEAGSLVNLTGTLIVARDAAHQKIAQMVAAGEEMPEYFINHPIYYAGPAKAPEGMPSGSFGPTTAQRMDMYVEPFMKLGASRVILAKGDRADEVTHACEKYRGVYMGTIGGAAALVAQENIKSVEVLAFPELGMEAVRKIRVENLPAFIICDTKGNNLYKPAE